MSRLSVDGVELVCEERGVGRPLVLVHGTGFRTEMWGSVLEELSARHRVLAYDRRGYGRSVHRPVRDYRRHVSDAIAVIERLAAAPAVVVGHSSGASIALALAARRPDLVRALIVAEPPFHGLRHATGGLLAVIARAKLIQWLGRPERAAVLAFRWLSSYRTGGNGFDRLTAQDRALLLGNRRSVLAELDPHPTGVLFEHVSLRALAGIPAPITLLLADLSQTWFHRCHAALVRAIPTIHTEQIPGAGHYMPSDAPAEFIAAVQRGAARAA